MKLLKDNMEGKCSYINPDNPCHCKNWVAYALRNNKMDSIPRMELRSTVDYEKIYNSEMDFLTKITMMYNSHPERRSYEEFINHIKVMVADHSLRLFS